jgi:eukaryotic-like serine/threonine-protein kinase
VLPSLISHYSILSKLGEGGMGELYLAEDTILGRRVVIKVLSAKVAADEQARKRLIREAKTVSSLDHPNICTVYEVGEVEGRNFIAMQYVEGDTLDEYIDDRVVGFKEALDIASQIAEALAEAHAKGIVHRDIKPQNIIVNPKGQVKVLDFGLAKKSAVVPTTSRNAETVSLISEQHSIIGTIPYMSPEQACAEELDARSDIFSFGTVLYELLSGRHPFRRKSFGETISAILTVAPPSLDRPDVPEKLERILFKCLEKDKTDRYQNGRDLADALSEINRGGSGDTRRSTRKWGRPAAYAAAALLLCLLALIGISFRSRLEGAGESQAGAARIESIAVLPFSKEGVDESLDYLSEGLTDNLINSLSQLPEVKVIARTSVLRYKDKEVDPVAVSRELNVRALLTGKLSQQDGGVVLSVALIDAQDNRHLWGDRYTFNPSDMLRVQSAIAREVSERLRLKLPAPGSANPPKSYTENSEAYQMYLKGRHFYNKRTEDGLRKGIEYFNRAIDLDPNYALAYAGLSDTYALLGAAGYEIVPPEEAMARARAAAAKAIEIDDTLAEAHTSIAVIKLQFDWDWVQAESEFRRAIELKPNYALAHYWYSIYLMAQGRHEEAIAESRKALELDPLSMIVGVNVARAYYFARRYDAAVESCRQVIDLDDKFAWAYYFLGLSYLQKGAYGEAVTAFQECVELAEGNETFLSTLGYAYAVSGDRVKATRLLKQLELKALTKRVAPADMAVLYLGLGQTERALDSLEKACDERSNYVLGLKVEPVFDSLRNDPRYATLLSRIGLTPR